MLTMVLKRLAMAIPSLIGVVIVTFLLTRALPGDPAVYFAGPAATPQAIQQVRVNLGLDKPLIEQFGLIGELLGVARIRASCGNCRLGSRPRTVGRNRLVVHPLDRADRKTTLACT